MFLHWGPGSHCAVEREWFGESLAMLWWDQPSVREGDPNPGDTIFRAAEDRFLELFLENGGTVALYGHSVGGILATRLADAHPEKVSRIRLLGANERCPRAFVNLGTRLFPGADEVEAAKRKLDETTFWPLLGKIAAVPGFLDRYWGPSSKAAMARYQEIAARCAPLDLATFQAVLNADFKLRKEPSRSRFRGPVELLLGREDPLIDPKEELAHWKKIFPQVQMRLYDCGHFVHFELPTSEWFAG